VILYILWILFFLLKINNTGIQLMKRQSDMWLLRWGQDNRLETLTTNLKWNLRCIATGKAVNRKADQDTRKEGMKTR
jgi:hypothetical protein